MVAPTLINSPNDALNFGADSPPMDRPWRMGSYGDSRSVSVNTNTLLAITGSATGINSSRAAGYIAGILGDVEIVCNFGVSGDTASLWDSSSRANSKTINNLIAANLFKGGPVDVVYVQYGINDYIAGTSGATVAGYIQALCGVLMSSGFKVILEATNPASAAQYGATPSAKLAATIAGNALLKTWAAGFPSQLVFVDTFNALVDTSGYASASYFADGLHFNPIGAMLAGSLCATAARTILPRKRSYLYTSGSLLQPNLIDWGAMASGSTLFTVSDIGSVSFSTPTWNVDAVTGLPYAETIGVCTALSGGYARGHLEVHASTISGGSPRYPISVGDELQGTAYITIDDGNGGVAPIQAAVMRQRLYSDTKFSDDGVFVAGAGSTFVQPVARRFITPTIVTATASAGISAPAAGAGFPLQPHVEFNTVGQRARIRCYAPSLRVVSTAAQPTQPTAGASPYTYTNTTGAPVNIYIAGGTVSAITIARQGTAFTTGLTSGMFRLAQNDSITVTYTVIPTVTVMPDEAYKSR